jgi:outer membrane protein OmpA-like peptidoglycan-associated protein
MILNADLVVNFEVISHCDSRSSEEYNTWLGERSMNRTIDCLVSKGVDRSRIKGDHKGESQPYVK